MLPQNFTDSCTRAKMSAEHSLDEDSSHVTLGNAKGYVLHGKITELSGQQIQSVFANFRGANLTIASLPEVPLCSV